MVAGSVSKSEFGKALHLYCYNQETRIREKSV